MNWYHEITHTMRPWLHIHDVLFKCFSWSHFYCCRHGTAQRTIHLNSVVFVKKRHHMTQDFCPIYDFKIADMSAVVHFILPLWGWHDSILLDIVAMTCHSLVRLMMPWRGKDNDATLCMAQAIIFYHDIGPDTMIPLTNWLQCHQQLPVGSKVLCQYSLILKSWFINNGSIDLLKVDSNAKPDSSLSLHKQYVKRYFRSLTTKITTEYSNTAPSSNWIVLLAI